jgi:hypothetical protein
MNSRAANRRACHPVLGAFARAGLAWMLLSALLLGGCRSRSADSGDQSAPEGKKGAAQVIVEDGRTILTLDDATQRRLGIELATLGVAVARSQATFPAVVLSAEPLARYRASYVATQSELNKAQIRAGVARKEYERLKALSTPEQNVSKKALQSSEAAWQSDEADVRAARAQLELQDAALRQEWGDVITRWSAGNLPELEGILDRSHALVQLTIPAGAPPVAPKEISLELAGGRRVAARLVSPFPRVDPRIQGSSFLYLASGRHELAPGLNLVAHYAVGGARKGVLLPAPAVVWSEGQAWVYRQIAPGRFTRLPAATDLPVDGGYVALRGFSSGDKVVTTGAQDLLSEEILLHSQGGGDED